MKTRKVLFRSFTALILVGLLIGLQAGSAQAVSPDIVISQVYGGGGNIGALYRNDYIELFNRGTTSVSLAGWSVQYASATGPGNFGTSPITSLSGTLAPGQYLLVQEASEAANGVPLPTPDITGVLNVDSMGAKVALVTATTGLPCNGGSTSCTPAQLAEIKDLVGWDGANFFETAPAPATTNITALFRLDGGFQDTDNNSVDFTAAAPAPRNTASPFNPTPTPEPTTMLLLGLGLIGIAGVRRKIKK